MPHVNQPYLWGDTWRVVITATGLKKPAPRNLEVIPCSDRDTAWITFRMESEKYGQDNKTEDVTGRLPINWYAFHDWLKGLKTGHIVADKEYTVQYGCSGTRFPAMGKTGGMTPHLNSLRVAT